MPRGSVSKPKPPKFVPTDRTKALVHLANTISEISAEYIDLRYWEGFRTGLIQCAVQQDGVATEIDQMVLAEKREFKKRRWEEDPLQNGILNGRRFALTYLLNLDFEMIFGAWLTPA
jgi:hypothetical protein